MSISTYSTPLASSLNEHCGQSIAIDEDFVENAADDYIDLDVAGREFSLLAIPARPFHEGDAMAHVFGLGEIMRA